MDELAPTDKMFSISDKVLDEGDLSRNLKKLREHGFSHIHYSQAWRSPEPLPESVVAEWLEALQAANVRVLDVHGCHPPDQNLWDEDPTARAAAIRLFEHRLEVTHELGCDAMVYHVPVHCDPEPALMARFIDSLERVEEKARQLGVVVALENHYLRENDRVAFSMCFERFSPEFIGFTFDSGHAVRSGNTEWLMRNCFDRLSILHLHDNEPDQDRHWLPWHREGHVNWERVAEAIAASPYSKMLQFEVQWKKKAQPDHTLFLKDAYSRFARFEDMVNERRRSSPHVN